MSGSFEIRNFFRKMPADLIHEYFAARHGITFGVPEEGSEQTEIDRQLADWKNLPQEIKVSAARDFIKINDMADEAGIRAILDEAEFQDGGHEKILAQWEDFPLNRRVFYTFLHRSELWDNACLFHHSDSLPQNWWKKRKGFGHLKAETAPEAIEALAKRLGDYFFEHDGKGKNCRVEVLRRRNQDYFFAYPEDYSREVLEWNGNKLSARVAKQAYTVIFIYVQDEGTLDLMCKGNKTRIYEIQELFAQTILGIEKLPENERDSRIYELAPLLKPNFKFRYEPSSIIQSVAISKIRLTRRYTWDSRVVLESPMWKKQPEKIYEILESFSKACPLDSFFVTQAELKVVVLNEDGKEVTETIRLTTPNLCNLHREGTHAVLRKMLIDSEIEPRDLSDGGQT